ncbi:hypothetical protein BDR26DRAFT_858160 [Obelidium mucronatum]|nr:hypothetical protein BDR26DRAFT_858160 [Obelidium mucronatum]
MCDLKLAHQFAKAEGQQPSRDYSRLALPRASARPASLSCTGFSTSPTERARTPSSFRTGAARSGRFFWWRMKAMKRSAGVGWACVSCFSSRWSAWHWANARMPLAPTGTALPGSCSGGSAAGGSSKPLSEHAGLASRMSLIRVSVASTWPSSTSGVAQNESLKAGGLISRRASLSVSVAVSV